MCYSFIVASISIIVHSKRLLWFRCFFSSPTFPIGIDVDAKTRNRVYESSFRRIVPPLVRVKYQVDIHVCGMVFCRGKFADVFWFMENNIIVLVKKPAE